MTYVKILFKPPTPNKDGEVEFVKESDVISIDDRGLAYWCYDVYTLVPRKNIDKLFRVEK